MNPFVFQRLAALQAHRVLLPPGTPFCVIDGQIRGRSLESDCRARRAA